MNQSIACVALLVLSACGGSSANVGDAPADAAADIATAEAAAADAGADAAQPMDASDGTMHDAAPDDRIDPIEVGRSWTYDVTIFGTSPCQGGMQTGTTLSKSTVAGKDGYKVQSFCAAYGAATYAVSGDEVELYYSNQWVLALDAPVAEGHTWSNGVGTYTWHSAGSVTVPAGTFHDCWSATENVAYTAYTIFCRGVGPVRWYTKDLAGKGLDAQLRAKNF